MLYIQPDVEGPDGDNGKIHSYRKRVTRFYFAYECDIPEENKTFFLKFNSLPQSQIKFNN